MVGRPWRRCAGGGKRRGRCVCGARRGDMAATEGPVREEGLQGPLLPRAQARPRGPLRPSGRAPPAASGPAPPSGSGRAPPAGSGHRRNTCSLRPSATAGTRAASSLRPPATAVPGDLTLRRAEAGPRLQSQAPIEAASHSSSNTATVISDFSFVSFVSLLICFVGFLFLLIHDFIARIVATSHCSC